MGRLDLAVLLQPVPAEQEDLVTLQDTSTPLDLEEQVERTVTLVTQEVHLQFRLHILTTGSPHLALVETLVDLLILTGNL
jgi:hypothetical protein